MKTKLLLYCTKGKSSLNLWRAIGIKEDVHKAILSISEYQEDTELDDFMNVEFVKKYPKYAGERIIFRPTNLNGKIVAECECEVEEISCKIGSPFPYLEFEHELPKTCLTEEELEIYKRCRNHKGSISSKSATVSDYRMATGLEGLLAYLFLKERFDRLDEIMEEIFKFKNEQIKE